FMSRRPSSNTANRPQGPAPTITTSVLTASLISLAHEATDRACRSCPFRGLVARPALAERSRPAYGSRRRCLVNDSPSRPARATPPALADSHHLSSDQVRHGHTDAVGHVNNALYATYFETGRVQFTDALLADAGAVDLDTVLARI